VLVDFTLLSYFWTGLLDSALLRDGLEWSLDTFWFTMPLILLATFLKVEKDILLSVALRAKALARLLFVVDDKFLPQYWASGWRLGAASVV
jgi:hypothetical protein